MSAPLDVGVIDAAVDLLSTGGWVQGTLETFDGAHCAHGAVLATACTPGDAHLWRAVMRHRGLTERWNDEPGRTADEVSDRLAALRGVTADEMATVFGPNWVAVRGLVRRAAVLTDEEAVALTAAWGAAWDAAGDAARGAARALVVRELLLSTGEGAVHYATLTRPWATVIGPAHPDDTEVSDG